MSSSLLALLAFTPILVVGVLLVVLRWPASRAMPIAYLIVAGLALASGRCPAYKCSPRALTA